MTEPWVAAILLVVGAGLVLGAGSALARRRRDRVYGRLVAVDAGRPVVLRSERYRISGRPDVVRALPDGRPVPIELKSGPTPARGPYPSHRAQLFAYCLLLEETTGRSPPYGVLRYSDGEVRLRWDAAARQELLALRLAVARPYDGRAAPSPAKCAGCEWAAGCDARAS